MELRTDIEAGAYSQLDPGSAVESSPVLTRTYLRISLGDNRNLPGGSSCHVAKLQPVGLLDAGKPSDEYTEGIEKL